MDGGGRWAARGELNCQQDCLEVPCVQEVLVISPDKPGWLKRCVTNTGVNIRAIPPIWCPPWAPLSLHNQMCIRPLFVNPVTILCRD